MESRRQRVEDEEHVERSDALGDGPGVPAGQVKARV